MFHFHHDDFEALLRFATGMLAGGILALVVLTAMAIS